MINNIKIVEINSIKPSTYNPRSADNQRLELVSLSLRKLGFLLQVFADKSEIISGHQRHLVYKEKLKGNKIPLTNININDIQKRKALNIVFNRATNDFNRSDTPSVVNNKLLNINVKEMAKKLPDLKIDSSEFFPCVNAIKVPVNKLLTVNKGTWNHYARNLSNILFYNKIYMPLIIRSDFKIINGIGRLQIFAEKNIKECFVVIINNKQAEFAEAMLNLLSMEFNIHNKYSDLLRHNSFRRALTNRRGLGKGFFIAAFGNINCYEFKFDSQYKINKWKSYYGTKILDFGAGHLTDKSILNNIGVDVTPFEPYRITTKTNYINKEESLQFTNEFLIKIKNKYKWDSIFISSVLNSVPFLEDRKHIIRILAACSIINNSPVYAWIMSIKANGFLNMHSQALNEKYIKTIQFPLDYEPGIILGDFSGKPKIQKFHNTDEVKELFSSSFQNINIQLINESFSVVATGPKVERKALRKAIEFEFDLPYPDGSRMDRVDEAIKSFGERLGMKL